MAANSPSNSRFRKTPNIGYNGYNTIDRWNGFDWINTSPARTIVINSAMAGRLDLIANAELGTPELWWAIMYYNNQTDINWPRAGDEVKIPRLNYVLGEI